MSSENTSDWQDWYRLSFNYGLSFAQKLALLKRLSLPGNIFAASIDAVIEIIGTPAALAMREHQAAVEEGVEACALWLSQNPQHHLLTLVDPRYPKGLLDLSDPPLLLFACGDLKALQPPALALVGSRSASPQGIENALAFAKLIGKSGYCIASGLALGIDTAAHEGALAEGAFTIAVVGTGIDRVYPARNHPLAKQIALHGVLISELPLGAPPLPQHFPKRNRLIAALAKGVLVVEAAKQSGSLITAKLALEMGREVFAIPGSIHSAVSKGCHELIRQGAKLVEAGQDIVDELKPLGVNGENLPLWTTKQWEPLAPEESLQAEFASFAATDPSDPILSAMGFDPVPLLDIVERSKLPSAQVQTRLLELELHGKISRLDDGRLLQIVEAT
jgi:DNA processing protein